MPEPHSFDYAIIRVVPSVERGECVNVGVILFSAELEFLDGRIEPDWQRIRTLYHSVDEAELQRQLQHFEKVIRGDDDGGPIARLPQSKRFHWLVGPRSTVIQVSSPHSGLCEDPEAMLEHLMETMVRV
jgi:hypothetical protein